MEDKENRNAKVLSLDSLYSFLLLLFLFYSYFLFIDSGVLAGVGEDNVTVITLLEVGAAAAQINYVNVTPNSISLIPNDTVEVNCTTSITNFAGDTEIQNVTAELFDTVVSSFGSADSHNAHYTNSSCFINTSFGTEYDALATCSFDVYYNSNPGNWNCTVNVTNTDFSAFSSNSSTVESLLALGLPDTIDYGVVNATDVSLESVVNVTNYGNTLFNLSLTGYAQTLNDGYAMNCSLGVSPFISIEYEKYNLTDTTPGDLTLSQFENTYINLTDSSVVRQFELNYYQGDFQNNATNETYWRMYVPQGVGGNCTGNVVFGASLSPGV